MSMRFHWMMPKGGEVAMKTAQETNRVLTTKEHSPASMPDMEGWTRFARAAEEAGIEGVLLSFSRRAQSSRTVGCLMICSYIFGWVKPGSSPSLCPQRR